MNPSSSKRCNEALDDQDQDQERSVRRMASMGQAQVNSSANDPTQQPNQRMAWTERPIDITNRDLFQRKIHCEMAFIFKAKQMFNFLLLDDGFQLSAYNNLSFETHRTKMKTLHNPHPHSVKVSFRCSDPAHKYVPSRVQRSLTWFSRTVGGPRKWRGASAVVGSSIYLFGGTSHDVDCANYFTPIDVYRFDTLQSPRWTRISYTHEDLRLATSYKEFVKWYSRDTPYMTHHHTATEIGGKIYLLASEINWQAKTIFWEFDPERNTFRALPHPDPQFSAIRPGHAACRVGDTVLAVLSGVVMKTRFDQLVPTNRRDFWLYDTLSGSWSMLFLLEASNLSPEWPFYFAWNHMECLDGCLYVLDRNLEQLFKLDLKAASRRNYLEPHWEPIVTPFARKDRPLGALHSTTVWNGTLVICVTVEAEPDPLLPAYDQPKLANQFWIYDPNREPGDEWFCAPQGSLFMDRKLPIGRGNCYLHIIDSKLYMFGGETDEQTGGVFNKWENEQLKISGRRHCAIPYDQVWPQCPIVPGELMPPEQRVKIVPAGGMIFTVVCLDDMHIAEWGVPRLETLAFHAIIARLGPRGLDELSDLCEQTGEEEEAQDSQQGPEKSLNPEIRPLLATSWLVLEKNRQAIAQHHDILPAHMWIEKDIAIIAVTGPPPSEAPPLPLLDNLNLP